MQIIVTSTTLQMSEFNDRSKVIAIEFHFRPKQFGFQCKYQLSFIDGSGENKFLRFGRIMTAQQCLKYIEKYIYHLRDVPFEIKQLPEFKDISKPKLINDCKFYLDTSELVFTKAISNRSLKRGIK